MKLTLAVALVGALVAPGLAYNWCDPCKAVVGFIETEVTRDEGEEDKVLDAACADVCKGIDWLTKVCDLGVNEGLKIVVNDIDTKQPPPVVCHEAHLCDSRQTFEALAQASPVDGLCQALSVAQKAIDNKADVKEVCGAVQKYIPTGICMKAAGQLSDIVAKLQAKFCSSGPALEAAEAEAVDPAAVCQKVIQFAEAFLHKFFDNKYAHKYCKELAHMADIDLTCKDVKADMKKAIAALKAKCPKPAAEVEAVEKFDPSQACPALEAVESLLESKKLEEACQALQKAIPAIPADLCNALPIAAAEKIVKMAMKEIHCPSSVEVSPLLKLDPSQACPALEEILALLKDGDVGKLCDAIEKELPQLPKGFCQKLATGANGFEKILEIVVKLACPSSAGSLAVEGVDPSQICGYLPLLKKLVDNDVMSNPYAKTVCQVVAQKLRLSSCKDLVKMADTLIKDAENFCPSSAQFETLAVGDLDTSSKICSGLANVIDELDLLARLFAGYTKEVDAINAITGVLKSLSGELGCSSSAVLADVNVGCVAAHKALAALKKAAKEIHAQDNKFADAAIAKAIAIAKAAVAKFCAQPAVSELAAQEDFSPCALIPYAQKAVNGLFGNKYAKKYCKILKGMTNVNVTCKDVRKDLQTEINALKKQFHCSSGSDEAVLTPTDEGALPPQLCAALQQAKAVVASAEQSPIFKGICKALAAEIGTSCADLEKDFDGIINGLCPSSDAALDLSLLSVLAQTPACEAMKTALANAEKMAAQVPKDSSLGKALALTIKREKQLVAQLCNSNAGQMSLASHAALASEQLCGLLQVIQEKVQQLEQFCAANPADKSCQLLQRMSSTLNYLLKKLDGACPNAAPLRLFAAQDNGHHYSPGNDDWCDLWRDMGDFCRLEIKDLQSGDTSGLSPAEVDGIEAFLWLLEKLAGIGNQVNQCPKPQPNN